MFIKTVVGLMQCSKPIFAPTGSRQIGDEACEL